MSNKHQLNTKLIHAGEPEERYEGSVSMPIFQSSTFAFDGETNYDDLKYIRLNNTPNHIALHKMQKMLLLLQVVCLLFQHLYWHF